MCMNVCWKRHSNALSAPFTEKNYQLFFILFWSSFIRRLNAAYRSPTRFTTILWYFHLSLCKQSLLSNPSEHECNLIFFLLDISLCQFGGGGEKEKTAKNNCATFILYGSIFKSSISPSYWGIRKLHCKFYQNLILHSGKVSQFFCSSVFLSIHTRALHSFLLHNLMLLN